ncbi:hypothetical protein ACJIZ3_019325 [Penstemon smallii]|uniref:Pentatricopeptide repeat-containing protein-mitochondrial domain-containing protein n=1 Tax=Penstemon smallii TaxID=265156 RepID=A0ABD3T2B0_9LAMI
MLLRRLCANTLRCTSPLPFHSSILNFDYSTLESPLNSPKNNHSKTDESHVLSQLADLFPISINPPNNQPEIRAAADDFLPPEDKLRGVFLQKLRGRSSIHSALSCVGVKLNVDVFAKVVNRGNLSGESMVVFFNWAVGHQNIAKDVSNYNILVKALGRRKFFTHMMEMFDEMRENGVTPNLETLSIVMDSYVRARKVSKAINIFWELDKYGLTCDEETLSVLLKCLCRRSYVGSACSVFNKMKGKVQCNSEVYNVIIGGWSKLGRVTEVEKFLKAMVDDGVEPDCVTNSHVIEVFGRAGRVDDAVKVFKYLEEKGSGLSTIVYNAMIFNYIAAGDIDEALKYYEGMLSNSFEPNMDTYVRIILYFLKTRRVADAIEMFEEMLGRGLTPSTGTVTEFIEPLCRYGPPHAALMIYKKARKAGCRISLTAYKLLLMRLSRFGKCGMLLNIWGEMQESCYSSDMEVYEYIINGLCNTGQLETAVLVMEESLSKGFFPSKIICSKLHNKLLDSNKVEMSYKLFLKLKNARLNENAQRYWRAKGWHF